MPDVIKLLIDGYIRLIEQLLNSKIIPRSINSICFEYYRSTNVLFLFGGTKTKGIYIAEIDSKKYSYLTIKPIQKINYNAHPFFVSSSSGLFMQNNIKLPVSISDDTTNNLHKSHAVSAIFKCAGYNNVQGHKSAYCSAFIKQNFNITNNINTIYNWTLPSFDQEFSQNSLIFNDAVNSNYYGLISIGGDNVSGSIKDIYYLSFNNEYYQKQILNKWKWNKITDMTYSLSSPTSCIINQNNSNIKMIIVGGWSSLMSNYSNNTMCYNFNTKKWNKLCDASVTRSLSGICVDKFDNHRIYIGGGFGVSNIHEVEYYDMNKNKWYNDIPNTTMIHDYCPSMWIDNNLLYIASTSSNGMEYIDLRCNSKKWIVVYSSVNGGDNTSLGKTLFGVAEYLDPCYCRLVRYLN